MAVALGPDFKWFHHSPEKHEQYRTQKAGNELSSEDVFNKLTLNCGLREAMSTTKHIQQK